LKEFWMAELGFRIGLAALGLNPKSEIANPKSPNDPSRPRTPAAPNHLLLARRADFSDPDPLSHVAQWLRPPDPDHRRPRQRPDVPALSLGLPPPPRPG